MGMHSTPFQPRTLTILETLDFTTPPAIIRRYLDDDILNASHAQRLIPFEVKYDAREGSS